MNEQYKIKAVRVPDFDDLANERPYAVVFDIYDNKGNYIEQGVDWKYFLLENEAQSYCNKFNNTK